MAEVAEVAEMFSPLPPQTSVPPFCVFKKGALIFNGKEF